MLTWTLFHFMMCLLSVKPRTAAILFVKKVVILNFGFCSLRNDRHFIIPPNAAGKSNECYLIENIVDRFSYKA